MTGAYGWIDLHGRTILDGARELAAAMPELDRMFCNLHEYMRQDMKAAKTVIVVDGRRITIEPDVYCPPEHLHGINDAAMCNFSLLVEVESPFS